MKNAVLVFLGGGFGSLVRYALGLLVRTFAPTTFPLATFVVNVLSCLLVAVLFYFTLNKTPISETVKVLVIVGFCGGLSTFSAFSTETVTLIKREQFFYAALNVVLNILVCFAILYFLLKQKLY
jgi:fluoride exporter